MAPKHDACATRNGWSREVGGCARFRACYSDLLKQLGVNLILLLAPIVVLFSTFLRFGNQVPSCFCRLAEVPIDQMGIDRCRTMSPAPEHDR